MLRLDIFLSLPYAKILNLVIPLLNNVLGASFRDLSMARLGRDGLWRLAVSAMTST
jgi:hypothetical protein